MNQEADVREFILILIIGDLEQVRISKIEAIKNGTTPANVKAHAFMVITKLLKLDSQMCDPLAIEYDKLIDEQDALVGDEDVLMALQSQLAPII